ncbi:MAG: 4-hydroxy-tetrahydrodipicolinate reductase [Candidatus Eisenbacteria bacterium]|nr:4-hydroxy-tetrahydrodipicolinate reductase [Candidatus Eisenbacteria bacterium]
MIPVAVCGGGGRIGGDVAAAVAASSEFALAAILEREDHPARGSRLYDAPVVGSLHELPAECRVLVDFTAPPATDRIAGGGSERGMAVVSGATALEPQQHEALRLAAERVPVVYAPNMSMGVAVVNRLIREAARRLSAYDIEIVEMHHRRKRDAPSGTALRFAETLAQARGGLRRIHGREGVTGERSHDEVAVHALRGGDVVGEHQVILAGPGERVIISHRAESRGAFVSGVLQAIRFVAGAAAGLYAMEDVLGIQT